MQIVINIPEEMYQKIKETSMVISGRRSGKTFDYILFNAVNTGTPLPKGHSDLIDKKEAVSLIAEGKNGKAYFGTVEKDWEVIDFLKAMQPIIEADKVESEGKE